jgi:hypothetical protein
VSWHREELGVRGTQYRCPGTTAASIFDVLEVLGDENTPVLEGIIETLKDYCSSMVSFYSFVPNQCLERWSTLFSMF